MTESDYPTSTEAVREALDGVPVLDPIVAMTAMAVGTSTLRFLPGGTQYRCASPWCWQRHWRRWR